MSPIRIEEFCPKLQATVRDDNDSRQQVTTQQQGKAVLWFCDSSCRPCLRIRS
jgi:hypothetical protein